MEWETFHFGTKVDSKVLIQKLDDEDPANDWYSTAVYMKQLVDDVYFDWGHFWTTVWEKDGAQPDEVNWLPGEADYGKDPIELEITISWEEINAHVTWTHQTGSEWDIRERPTFDDANGWKGRMHHEFVGLKSRSYDWDTLTFTSAWKVAQGKGIGLHVGTQIGWNPNNPFDCWYPCHKDGSKCSPCVWYNLNPAPNDLCLTAEGVVKDFCTPMPIQHPELFDPEEVDVLEPEDLDALLSEATVCSPVDEPPEGSDWSETCVGSGGWEETDCSGRWSRHGHDAESGEGKPYNPDTGEGHYDPDGQGGHWTDQEDYERLCYDGTDPRYCHGTDDWSTGNWQTNPSSNEKEWHGGHWEETCVGGTDGCVAWHSEGTYDATRRRVEQTRDCDIRHACDAALQPVLRLVMEEENPDCAIV